MSWFPKILRRVIVLWCLYGLVRLVLLVHPHVVRLALLWRTADPGMKGSETDVIISTWLLLVTGVVVIGVVMLGVHHFSKMLFNERR